MRKSILFLATIIWLGCIDARAQKVLEVQGSFTYAVGENDNITLREAKRKCVELAKAEAIKAAFGEMITSDVIDTNAETDGEASSSYYWENTVAMARGDWLEDIEAPKIKIAYVGDRLLFTAEVHGKVREITQNLTDLQWSILSEKNGQKKETTEFKAGERVVVKFRSPADGYVAIYLITGDDETSCLLPYKKNVTGKTPIRHNKEYVFFDKDADPDATHYKLNTRHETEENQLVIIYSPNPFTKCNDITGDKRHPNSLSTHDFQKWLLKLQRADKDMVINKRWIKIRK